MNARITFIGNPWPAGHPATLRLHLRERDGEPGLAIHLRTASYSAELDVPDDDEAPGDWQAPIVWNNYSRATFEGWIPLPLPLDALAELDGLELRADHDKLRGHWDWDDLAFDHCYLLGHDAIAGHTLRFAREGEVLKVHWTGKIALAYAGDYGFDHEFELRGQLPLT